MIKLCCKPEICQEQAARIRDLDESLRECREGSQNPKPPLDPPTYMRNIDYNDLHTLINEMYTPGLRYLKDVNYGAPLLSEFHLYVLWVAAWEMPFIEDEQDCDDFTLKLKAAAVGVPGWRRMFRADVNYNHPIQGPHSELLTCCVDDMVHNDNRLALIITEGQLNPQEEPRMAIRIASDFLGKWRPWLIDQ